MINETTGVAFNYSFSITHYFIILLPRIFQHAEHAYIVNKMRHYRTAQPEEPEQVAKACTNNNQKNSVNSQVDFSRIDIAMQKNK